jgi:class 3 adenylate cyclase/tetratricopeptide (TPR) repeat protein
MELLADRDPEDARKLLDPVLERMMQAVRRYEGMVTRVTGDGIIALFGAPLAQEDHAVRACFAAITMQELVRQSAEETCDKGGVNVQIQVGLDSGEVVVRAIGSDGHRDYSAVGQTTHRAARMVQLARPGSILLTRSTLELVEGFVSVSPLGAMPIEGRPASIEAYEVTGARLRRSRFSVAAARGLTRFVGRNAELKQLDEALARAAGGRGQMVAIVGEPGVGKSRLVWELTRSHCTRGWLILRAGAVSYGKTTPYLPLVNLLKDYLRVEDRDGTRAIREKAAGKLVSLDGGLDPALLSLFDIPVDDPQWEVLDPPQRRHRTLDAVRRLFLRESQVQPLLVVLEDLHWIDAETQALLDSVVASLSRARILVLVNYRPEYRPPWGGKTNYVQLRLDPLGPKHVSEMLESLLGRDTALAPLRRLLASRAEGNPFFVEESVRSLAEDGVLVGARGAYQLAKSGESVRVPPTIQVVLAERIDRLAPEDKELLQTAAVVGTEVPVAVLAAITERRSDALADALARLQASECLYETSLPPAAEYAFRHALIHDVVYASLLQDRRRALHARTVEALERLYPERLGEHVERLAHHAVRGEAWVPAVAYLRQAGTKATERSAYGQAMASFEQALDVLRHLPEGREQTEQACDLHLDASGALIPLGELARSTSHARQAEALAKAIGDERRLGWAQAVLAHRAWYSGDSDLTLAMGQRALTIASSLCDDALERSASFPLGLLMQTTGNYGRAAELLSRTVEAVQGNRVHYRLYGAGTLRAVFARERLAWCLAELGEFACASARGEQAVQIASEVDHHHSLVLAHRSLGFIALRRGDIVQAIGPLERAVKLCRAIQARSVFDVAAAELGYAYALTGRLPEGVALIEEALADPAATGTTNHSLLLAYLGEAHLLAGRSYDAIAVARRAVDLARNQNERGNEAWALRLLGEIVARGEGCDRRSAEEHYRQTLVRAEELGMRPLSAHCHLGLGKLFRHARQRRQARQQLTTATAMYRHMDMPFWLERSEVEMRKLG